MKSGNLLILQSGNPSVVGNAVLYGMLSEALNYEAVEEIYGAYNGFEGVLQENWIDLASLSQRKAQLLLTTEGCALRSEVVSNFTEQDFEKIVKILSAKNIRYIGIIGDQRSLKLAEQLSICAEKQAYELQVMVVPQSNYNELPMTDHSLGYGSYLKYLNAYLLSFDNFLQNSNISVGICEIEGGNNGWLVAGAALNYTGKSVSDSELPYIVCLPELPFNEENFLNVLREKMAKNDNICIITHSQLVNEEGLALDLRGCASAGNYLQELLQRSMNLSAYLNICDMGVQPLSHFISKTDSDEAIVCGRKVINALLDESESNKVAVLTRKDNVAEVSFLPLEDMQTGTKFFPSDWINEKTMTIGYSLVKYAQPFINGELVVPYEKGLPQLVRL